MPWLPKERLEEWVQDELVQVHKARWEGKKEEAVRSLRTKARQADLDDVRAAEARIATIEEFLKDYEEEEEKDE